MSQSVGCSNLHLYFLGFLVGGMAIPPYSIVCRLQSVGQAAPDKQFNE